MNLFRRTTASVALVALVSGIFSTGVSAYDASELMAANALAAKGFINTQNDAAGYNLDATITRGEMAKVAANIAGVEANTSCENKFADVTATTPNNWVCGYAEALLAKGLVSANANFNPNANISKSESVKLMLTAAGENVSFTNATWQADFVAHAVENGFVNTFSDYNTSADRGFVFGTASAATTEEEGDIISDLEDLLNPDNEDDDTTTTPTTPTMDGDDVLEVTLSSDTAETATIPGGVNGFEVASFDFTAGSEDVTVTQITVKRKGLSDDETIQSLAVFSDAGRASNSKDDNQENDTEAQLNLSDGGVVVKAGETRTLTIVADLGTSATPDFAANDEFALELVNVVASSSVEGLGDVVANTMRIGSVDAPTITFTPSSSVSDPKIGEEGADIFEFEIEGDSNEDVIIKSITFEGSSDAEDDLANFELVYNNEVIATTASMNDDYLTFTLNEGFVVEEDKNEDFTVRADVIEGASDDIEFRIDEALDVTAESTKFGFGATVDIDQVNTFTDLKTITIEAGELTLVEIEPDFDEIREDKDNVVLGGFKVTNVAGQNLELKEFAVKVNLTAGDARLPGNATGSLTLAELFDDVELYNEETGSSYELTLDGTVYEENNIDVVLPQGTTVWSIRADTAEDIDLFDTASFDLSFTTGKITVNGGFLVEETEDDEVVSDITPSQISFNTIDGSESGAQVSLIPLSDIDVVRGAKDVVALQFEVEAEESSLITVEELVATITMTGSAAATNQEITEVKLYKGSYAESNFLDAVSGSDLGSAGDATFDDFAPIVIDANATQEFIVTVSFVDGSDAVNNSDYTITLTSLDIEDDDNDDVDTTAGLVSARVMTVNNAGTITTVELDDANEANEFDKLVLAGEDVVIASYDVRGDNEEIDVETATFTVAGFGGTSLKNTIINASLLLDGVLVATNSNSDISNTSIVFEDMSDLILPETTSELELRLNTANVGEDFTGESFTGVTITQLVLSDAEGEESGKTVSDGTSSVTPSKTLDLVSAIVTPSVTSTFGSDDQTAEIRLVVDAGNNTDTSGDAIQATLEQLNIEVSSLSATGTITVFNGNGDNLGTAAVTTNGTVSVNVTDDSIGNDNEIYRIETTAEAIYRLAKDGVTYTDGTTSFSTKLENTLEVGQYSNSN